MPAAEVLHRAVDAAIQDLYGAAADGRTDHAAAAASGAKANGGAAGADDLAMGASEMRRRRLLEVVRRSRHRLIQCLALVNWLDGGGSGGGYRELRSTHESLAVLSAESSRSGKALETVSRLATNLPLSRGLRYDVATATDASVGGTYSALPLRWDKFLLETRGGRDSYQKAKETAGGSGEALHWPVALRRATDLGGRGGAGLPEDMELPSLAELNRHIEAELQRRLCETDPASYPTPSSLSVRDGRLTVTYAGQSDIVLTLAARADWTDLRWQVLGVKVLSSNSNADDDGGAAIGAEGAIEAPAAADCEAFHSGLLATSAQQLQFLRKVAERAMNGATPGAALPTCVKVVHEFSLGLAFESLVAQADALAAAREAAGAATGVRGGWEGSVRVFADRAARHLAVAFWPVVPELAGAPEVDPQATFSTRVASFVERTGCCVVEVFVQQDTDGPGAAASRPSQVIVGATSCLRWRSYPSPAGATSLADGEAVSFEPLSMASILRTAALRVARLRLRIVHRCFSELHGLSTSLSLVMQHGGRPRRGRAALENDGEAGEEEEAAAEGDDDTVSRDTIRLEAVARAGFESPALELHVDVVTGSFVASVVVSEAWDVGSLRRDVADAVDDKARAAARGALSAYARDHGSASALVSAGAGDRPSRGTAASEMSTAPAPGNASVAPSAVGSGASIGGRSLFGFSSQRPHAAQRRARERLLQPSSINAAVTASVRERSAGVARDAAERSASGARDAADRFDVSHLFSLPNTGVSVRATDRPGEAFGAATAAMFGLDDGRDGNSLEGAASFVGGSRGGGGGGTSASSAVGARQAHPASLAVAAVMTSARTHLAASRALAAGAGAASAAAKTAIERLSRRWRAHVLQHALQQAPWHLPCLPGAREARTRGAPAVLSAASSFGRAVVSCNLPHDDAPSLTSGMTVSWAVRPLRAPVTATMALSAPGSDGTLVRRITALHDVVVLCAPTALFGPASGASPSSSASGARAAVAVGAGNAEGAAQFSSLARARGADSGVADARVRNKFKFTADGTLSARGEGHRAVACDPIDGSEPIANASACASRAVVVQFPRQPWRPEATVAAVRATVARIAALGAASVVFVLAEGDRRATLPAWLRAGEVAAVVGAPLPALLLTDERDADRLLAAASAYRRLLLGQLPSGWREARDKRGYENARGQRARDVEQLRDVATVRMTVQVCAGAASPRPAAPERAGLDRAGSDGGGDGPDGSVWSSLRALCLGDAGAAKLTDSGPGAGSAVQTLQKRRDAQDARSVVRGASAFCQALAGGSGDVARAATQVSRAKRPRKRKATDDDDYAHVDSRDALDAGRQRTQTAGHEAAWTAFAGDRLPGVVRASRTVVAAACLLRGGFDVKPAAGDAGADGAPGIVATRSMFGRVATIEWRYTTTGLETKVGGPTAGGVGELHDVDSPRAGDLFVEHHAQELMRAAAGACYMPTLADAINKAVLELAALPAAAGSGGGAPALRAVLTGPSQVTLGLQSNSQLVLQFSAEDGTVHVSGDESRGVGDLLRRSACAVLSGMATELDGNAGERSVRKYAGRIVAALLAGCESGAALLTAAGTVSEGSSVALLPRTPASFAVADAATEAAFLVRGAGSSAAVRPLGSTGHVAAASMSPPLPARGASVAASHLSQIVAAVKRAGGAAAT